MGTRFPVLVGPRQPESEYSGGLLASTAGASKPPRGALTVRLDTEEVTGSNPVSPSTKQPLTSGNAGQGLLRAV